MMAMLITLVVQVSTSNIIREILCMYGQQRGPSHKQCMKTVQMLFDLHVCLKLCSWQCIISNFIKTIHVFDTLVFMLSMSMMNVDLGNK